MSTTHTQTRWTVAPSGNVLDHSGNRVAFTEYMPGGDKAIRLANARLIAAAPELLAMLEKLVPEMPDLGDIDLSEDDNALLDEARALIAKVKGIK